MLAEGLLQRMQRAVRRGNAFDGGDLRPIGLTDEHGAGFHRLAVDIDGAGAAMARLATDMRAGEFQMLPEKMDQECARFGKLFDLLSVDRHFDVQFGHFSISQLS